MSIMFFYIKETCLLWIRIHTKI